VPPSPWSWLDADIPSGSQRDVLVGELAKKLAQQDRQAG